MYCNILYVNQSFTLPRFFIFWVPLCVVLWLPDVAGVVYPSSILTPLSVPFVIEVIPTDKVDVAFKDLDAAILVGSMPRREGMERKDLLKANVAIFKSQGEALDKYAKKTVKVNNRTMTLT